ncbi:hypothetical protein JOD29_000830 [Lysinibacillus composti]|uniref:Uncharacterized protein n=1 Tax=Lysinibacillus composti TaxID=720633 RepID=A0A3N9UIL9_9BACI|nr:hypothetical protein [Lysinibacillus composti]MBM7607586.1 hypothetical protein [Lysinibacillus composti]RQW75909.1 hypothetical protein EBB45_04645 [Lysinibacillus composti]
MNLLLILIFSLLIGIVLKQLERLSKKSKPMKYLAISCSLFLALLTVVIFFMFLNKGVNL